MPRIIDPSEIPEEVARFALLRAGEEGLASLREHGAQLGSDEEFETFMDEAEAEALRQH